MRMFVGVAATLTLASGVAVAAAGLAQNAQQPGVWVSKDGTRTTIVGARRRRAGRRRPVGRRRADTWRCLPDAARSWASRCGSWMPSRPRARAGPSSTRCAPGSAAEKAGIKKGDVIAEFDGERVRGVRHLTRLVTETPDGRTVKAAVVREGKRVDLSVTPDSGSLASAGPQLRGARAADAIREDAAWRRRHDLVHAAHARRGVGLQGGRPGEMLRAFKSEKGRLGLKIQELDGQLGEYFGTSNGVLVNSVDADSPAARAGLKAGDVVTAVNGKAVAEPSDLIEAVQAAEDGATLRHRLHARQEGAVDQGHARQGGARGAAAEAAAGQPALTVPGTVKSCPNP